MKNVFILYNRYYSLDGKEKTVGGIQTYITMLNTVISKAKMKPIIYQYANEDFKIEENECTIVGVKVNIKWKSKKKKRVLFEAVKTVINKQDDLIIFASDNMIVPCKEYKSIAIQHGIYWDIPMDKKISKFKNKMYVFFKAIKAYKIISRISKIKNIVCVDYNFINWYRTQVAYTEPRLTVIPNCTEISEVVNKPTESINIMFARRFFYYRGTRVYAEVVKKLLDKYSNVKFLFAGDGPDKNYLKSIFKTYDRVEFMKYSSEDSLKIHSEYHIAVVPTLGSEGTSLALLEAMSTQCAVVATNVGGMTNVILNKYNGILTSPTIEELFNALVELIEDSNLRNRIAQNGYDTVKSAFAFKNWEENWIKVLNEIV